MSFKSNALMSCIALVFVVILPLVIVQFFRLQQKKQDAANESMRRHLEQVCDTEARR